MYHLKVPDAAAFIRQQTAHHARAALTFVDTQSLDLTIRPPTEADEATPITPLEQALLLRGSKGIDMNSPKLKDTAKGLSDPTQPPAVIAARVVSWVHDNISYVVTPETVGVGATLETRRGDCTELSNLAVGLLRQAGIPARPVDGLLLVGNELTAHAWVEYYDGARFREIDPTNNQTQVGSGHIPFDLNAFMHMRIKQQLKVQSVRATAQ